MIPLPYADLSVLDLSQGVAGPYCAALLAQQGARVIKVEPPGGDWARVTGGGKGGMTPIAIACNLGKRAISIDATRPPGRDLLARLAHGADIVIQNYRPGVIERLGLDYVRLAADHPRLLYLSITGFGATGPDARRAGTDSIIQSYTGMARLNRDQEGTPRRIPLLLPDFVTGLYGAQALGAALYARERSGRGRHIEISLLEACAAFQIEPILDDCLFSDSAPPPRTIPSGVFRTADGWLTVVTVGDAMFESLLRSLGLDAWIGDARFATLTARQQNAQFVNEEVARQLLSQPSAHWLERFAAADVLAAEPIDFATLRAHPQARHLGVFDAIAQAPYGELPVPRVPGLPREATPRAAPRFAEHTRVVLAEAGLEAAEIERLLAEGVIRAAD